MIIEIMPSLGDAIYHRPFVKALSGRVWIETKWPDLFCDIQRGPPEGQRYRARYDSKTLAFRNIVQSIERAMPPIDKFCFDLPLFEVPDLPDYAVIRAPTIRKDFYGPARNPKPEYIREAAQILKSFGLVTVGVGNVRDGLEWFDGQPPAVDLPYWNGELGIPELMGLVSGAYVVVGGPGWTVPAAMAYHVPHVTICGGAGAVNKPEKLTDPRIDCTKMSWIYPDNFCLKCKDIRHSCDKIISEFEGKFINAVNQSMHMRVQDIQIGKCIRAFNVGMP